MSSLHAYNERECSCTAVHKVLAKEAKGTMKEDTGHGSEGVVIWYSSHVQLSENLHYLRTAYVIVWTTGNNWFRPSSAITTSIHLM